MRALVLGATGHIGNAMVRELLHSGHCVSVVSTRANPAANLAGLAVRYIHGDIDAPHMLDVWVQGHDLVVDAAAPYPLAAFPHPGAEHPLNYADRRIRALLDAVWTHNARLAFVSSFTTIRRSRRLYQRFAAQLHPYFAVKDHMEALVLSAACRGLPTIVINPTMCLGPWDLKPRRLCFVPQLLCAEIPIILHHTINIIDVREVALGMMRALQAERYGEPILLSGHNTSIEALYSWICQLGRVPPPRYRVPMSLSVPLAYGTEALLASTRRSMSWYSLGVILLNQHDWLAPSEAQRELGIGIRPLSQTLLESIEWYRALGYC